MLHRYIIALIQGCHVASSCGNAQLLKCLHLQSSGAGWVRLMMMKTVYISFGVSNMRTMVFPSELLLRHVHLHQQAKACEYL